jgi:phosphate transport system substrate-binding protein
MRKLLVACVASVGLAVLSGTSSAQQVDLSKIPKYKPEYKVVGSLRIAGNFLKGNVALLIKGFEKYQPAAIVSTNFQTSSEGALGMMYAGASDIATMGDDAKITDQMPFFNSYGYTPTEISIATGGYEARGTLYPWAIAVNKANPIAKLSMGQLDRIFGSERTGGWSVGDNPEHDILFTAKYARPASSNIRTWGQLGLSGSWANREIQTYGYAAPGYAVNFERLVMHWSSKWNSNFKQFVEEKEATSDAYGKPVTSDTMLEELSHDKYGIAWLGLMHIDGSCVTPEGKKCPSYPGVKVLAISRTDGGKAIPLTKDNVENRSYPLSRDAYIYVNRAPGQPLEPKVREFVRFVLSREGQEIIAKAGIYYPLPDSYIQKQLAKVD